MNKETWIKHIEASGEIVRPSRGGERWEWKAELRKHIENGCKDCEKRSRTRERNWEAMVKRQGMKDLGLKRVKGASGRIYYE